jgi:transcriptional regulator of arginine metabolism
MSLTGSKTRLEALRKLLSQGTLSTQDDLREKLEKLGHRVTQSTISRDLRKLGTVKVIDLTGQTSYRLSEEGPTTNKTTALFDLIINIKTNGVLVVIHTTPGSASMIARHLDRIKPTGILGTLAGDDTVFVALPANRDAKNCIKEIEASFHGGI